MKIDIWTDIVCPYCYLGRSHLETALAGFEHRDEIEVAWHSFELDRNAEAVSQQDLIEMVAAKYGASREQMVAYFTEGRPIGDRETLADLAAEIGLDRDEVVAMLNSDDYGNHVRSDEATATMLGITGVPFFVFDRKYGVSGAQPVDVLTQALETAWSTRHERPEPVTASAGCGGGCGSGGCGGACAR